MAGNGVAAFLAVVMALTEIPQVCSAGSSGRSYTGLF